ncbi:MAG: aldehyde dehydrogenase family protein [Erythrobacter sp.]
MTAMTTGDIVQAKVPIGGPTKGYRASRRLRAAGVMINDSTDYRLDAMPFGGVKRGNFGREGVAFAAREMSQSKVKCTKIAL